MPDFPLGSPIEQLRVALAERGLAFAPDESR